MKSSIKYVLVASLLSPEGRIIAVCLDWALLGNNLRRETSHQALPFAFTELIEYDNYYIT